MGSYSCDMLSLRKFIYSYLSFQHDSRARSSHSYDTLNTCFCDNII